VGDLRDGRRSARPARLHHRAANYLHHSGSPADDRRALFAYNHSREYVDAVLRYANQMKRDPRNYYVYYSWQVFVVTTSGDRRITGPGL